MDPAVSMAYAEPRFLTENHIMPLTTGPAQVTLSPQQPSSLWRAVKIRPVYGLRAQIGMLFCLKWFRIVKKLPFLVKNGYTNASAKYSGRPVVVLQQIHIVQFLLP